MNKNTLGILGLFILIFGITWASNENFANGYNMTNLVKWSIPPVIMTNATPIPMMAYRLDHFTRLVMLLDERDLRWRQKMVIMLDYAPYHTSKNMMAFYERNRVPIIFTGPHSYVSNQHFYPFGGFQERFTLYWH